MKGDVLRTEETCYTHRLLLKTPLPWLCGLTPGRRALSSEHPRGKSHVCPTRHTRAPLRLRDRIQTGCDGLLSTTEWALTWPYMDNDTS